MILKALRVLRYRALDQRTFDFAPGINVIVGPNEAGKSSLRAAVRTALYGNPATTSPKVKDDQTWGTADLHVLALEFDVDGKLFTLTKDFARRKASLTDSTGRVWDVHSKVQERIGAELGLASDALFDATAQIVQAELERTHLNSIAKELGQKVSGAGEDVMTAIRRLDQAIKDLDRGTKSPVKEPGILRTLEERKQKLESDANRLRAAAADLERKQHELLAMTRTRGELAETLSAKRALLVVNAEILRLEKDAEALRREERLLDDRLRKIEDALTRIAQTNKALEAATAAGAIEETALRELRRLGERGSLRDTEAADLAAAVTPGGGISKKGPWLGIAAVVLAAAGTATLWAGQPLVGALVLAAAALAGGVAYFTRQRGVEADRLAEARRLEREHRLTALQTEIAAARQELADRLAETGSRSLDELERRFTSYQSLAEERRTAAETLSVLLEGTSQEDVAERRTTVRRDLFGLDERLRAPDYASRRLTPLEVQTLEHEVERMARELAGLEEKERRRAWEVEQLSVDAETLAALDEQWEQVSEELAAAHHRHGVYQVALDGLSEARREAEVEYREVVQTRARDYLRILSDGRYGRLTVEKESMEVQVWSGEAGTWVRPSEPNLSRGTVDLVYLSVRLALVDVLAGGKRPPLLLDDPFVAFDAQRKAAAARLLKELSRSYQILLFTCTRDFDLVADKLIELSPALPAESTPHVPLVREEVEVVPSVGPLWDRNPH